MGVEKHAKIVVKFHLSLEVMRSLREKRKKGGGDSDTNLKFIGLVT
jgi:hypothetical protein